MFSSSFIVVVNQIFLKTYNLIESLKSKVRTKTTDSIQGIYLFTSDVVVFYHQTLLKFPVEHMMLKKQAVLYRGLSLFLDFLSISWPLMMGTVWIKFSHFQTGLVSIYWSGSICNHHVWGQSTLRWKEMCFSSLYFHLGRIKKQIHSL